MAPARPLASRAGVQASSAAPRPPRERPRGASPQPKSGWPAADVRRAPGGGPRTAAGSGLRALVVEDDPVVGLLLRHVLEQRGHDVTACADGDSAWTALQRDFYPLVLLDWLLPGVDGLELCRRLKATPEGRGSFVLMVTSRGSPEDLEAALDAGVDDYLLKPLDVGVAHVRLDIAEWRIRSLERERRLEDQLSRERDLLARVMETSPSAILTLDAQGRVRFANRRAEEVLGWTRTEMLGRRYDAASWRATDPDGAPLAPHEHTFAKVVATGQPVYGDRVTIEAPGGGRRTLSVNMAPLRTDDGAVASTVAVIEDVTEAVRAREALERSERRYRELFEHMIDGFAVHEILCDEGGRPVDYRFLDVNPAFERLTGLRREKVLGRTVLEVMPDTEPLWIETYGAVALVGQSVRFEQHAGALGKTFDVAAFCPAPGQFAVHFVDVTDRVQAEEALRRSEERLKAAVDNLPVMLYAFHEDGRVAFWNRECERVTGCLADEVLGALVPLETFCPEAGAAREGAAPPTGGPREGTLRCRDGSERQVVWTELTHRAPVPGWSRWGVGIDVTEHRRLEQQLLQSQKMEALGRLAGGVAHDFNNLLTAILGYCDLISLRGPPGDPQLRDVEEIRKAGTRAALLTQQLLAFSRRQELQPSVLDLNEAVRDLARMLRRLIGEDVELRIDEAPAPALVCVDAGQLHQIVVNLAVNARDAMPHGGRMTLRVALPDGVEDHPPGGAAEGAWVLLSVSDTGHGMDEATLGHIFEPFYTTKPAGAGTGLGLSTVQGIVQQSGGHIRVRSRVGEGTTFDVYLHRVHAPSERGRPGCDEALRAAGSETVLLVEDSEGVLELVQAVLAAGGYRVLTASTPEEALRAAEQAQHRVDLLLADVVLPGRSGPSLAEELRRRAPDLRVLYMSGYPDDGILRQGIVPPEARLLQKPFRAHTLTEAVRQTLDA